MEKTFMVIYGNPENFKNVCREILEAMQLADTYTHKGINDIEGIKCERIIPLKGSIENMSKAKAQNSAKRKQRFKNYLQSMASYLVRPIAVFSATGITYLGHVGPNSYQPFAPASYPPMYPPTIPPINSSHAADVQETSFLFLPNSAVGSIIGAKGSKYIRNMIRFSGESVEVASIENENPGPSGDMNSAQQASRKVTIGTAETQWKAHGMIFDKLLDEGLVPATEEVRLTVEILVPSSQVDRIIGRSGSNVRELQRVTSSIIKLPTQGLTDGPEDTTTVRYIGRFLATHLAQSRNWSMVATRINPVPRTLQRNSSPTKTPQQ